VRRSEAACGARDGAELAGAAAARATRRLGGAVERPRRVGSAVERGVGKAGGPVEAE
jgi:hypothetical protein